MKTTAKPCIAAIIPAYNEEDRIAAVIETVLRVPLLDMIVIVSDGSTDRTVEVASRYAVRVEALPANLGKGGAMLHGARLARGMDILVFLDADLVGLRPEHVEALVLPVVERQAQMTLGQFKDGRGLTDLAQRLVTCISGQRAIVRDLFLSIPDLDRVGYGIEMAITFHVRANKLAEEWVPMRGVTHPMKEEKLGFLPGAWSRARMYAEMGRFWASYHFRGRAPKKALMPKQEKRQEVIRNGRSEDNAVDPVQHASVAGK